MMSSPVRTCAAAAGLRAAETCGANDNSIAMATTDSDDAKTLTTRVDAVATRTHAVRPREAKWRSFVAERGFAYVYERPWC